MNSYERIMLAMKLKQPDRVPISEFVIDEKVFKALVPGARYQSDLEDAYDLDTVTSYNRYLKISESRSSFTDEWGIIYKDNDENVLLPLEGPIKTYADFLKYEPPDPDRPERLGRLVEFVGKYKKQKAIVFHQRAGFLWASFLVGLENMLVYFLTQPDFAHELLDKIVDVNIRLARNAIRAGADIIVESDDYAYNSGLMFSPAIYDEFIHPRLKRFVDAVHDEGGLVVKHSDGDLSEVLDKIVSTGIDGLNPIDPLAGMDIGAVKEEFGHRVCIWGNIDCSNLLTFGDIEDVRVAVQDCISKASKGGGFVLTSSNSIHKSVKPENYKAMIEFGRQYGIYHI
ncbi:MAG: uroporphyrinogen decarboxylase family protein [Saccharofermentanales bacterium]